MADRSRYTRHADLYRRGITRALPLTNDDETGEDNDPVLLWVKVVTATELDEARTDGQIAAKRLKLAMDRHESSEAKKFRANYEAMSRAEWIDQVVAWETRDAAGHARAAVQSDPDWADRFEVFEDHHRAIVEVTADETDLIDEIKAQVSTEILYRTLEARAAAKADLTMLAESDPEAVYRRGFDVYAEAVCAARAAQEHFLTLMWLSLRLCDATVTTPPEVDEESGLVLVEGVYDHSACGHHKDLRYESKDELRDEHPFLIGLYQRWMQEVNFSREDAKKAVSGLSS